MNNTAQNATNGIKNILVLDDAASVADLIQEMLLSFGYCVALCSTVEEALAKFEPSRYDLIITDYTMPLMNGVEFAHLIRKQSPEQKILLITGSTFSMPPGASRLFPVNVVLQKPFSVAEFQDSVAGLLAMDQIPAETVLPPPSHSSALGNQAARGNL
jgi:two-component system, OmpR family, response regulator VicR